MRLSADIKWIGCSSMRMGKYLSCFVCRNKSNVNKIVQETASTSSDKVEVSVKCGKVADRSSFVFLKRSRNKSKIVGTCSTNRLKDLIDDFDFLKEQMNKSNLTFKLSDPRIILDENELIEKSDKRFLKTIRVLADFLGIFGFISGASAYLLLEEFNQITLVSLVLGLTFCVGSVVLGFWNQPKYVIIEQEPPY